MTKPCHTLSGCAANIMRSSRERAVDKRKEKEPHEDLDIPRSTRRRLEGGRGVMEASVTYLVVLFHTTTHWNVAAGRD